MAEVRKGGVRSDLSVKVGGRKEWVHRLAVYARLNLNLMPPTTNPEQRSKPIGWGRFKDWHVHHKAGWAKCHWRSLIAVTEDENCRLEKQRRRSH